MQVPGSAGFKVRLKRAVQARKLCAYEGGNIPASYVLFRRMVLGYDREIGLCTEHLCCHRVVVFRYALVKRHDVSNRRCASRI